jgi:hypothetical protein
MLLFCLSLSSAIRKFAGNVEHATVTVSACEKNLGKRAGAHAMVFVSPRVAPAPPLQSRSFSSTTTIIITIIMIIIMMIIIMALGFFDP